MRFLRPAAAFLAVLALLAAFPCALAEETYYGSVVCERTQTVPAPFGGVLEGLTLRKGDLIRTGEPICTIGTTFIYSPVAGTVSGVFGTAGDSVEDVKDRHGGVMYIVPANRYSVSASTEEAAKNPDCYVSVGQAVWIKKGRGRAPVVGTGVITSVSSEQDARGRYTVEIESGIFSPDESVGIYHRESADATALLGFGTVQQTAPVILSGEGSILRMYVSAGSEVTPGTPLYETVSGTLKKDFSGDNRVLAPEDAIVASVEAADGASVEQNAALVTLYPLEGMEVCISVPETSLPLFPAGQTVNLAFSTGEEQEGTVRSVDYLADADESAQATIGYASYKVHISFGQKEGIRQGMLVTVVLPDPAEEAEEE